MKKLYMMTLFLLGCSKLFSQDVQFKTLPPLAPQAHVLADLVDVDNGSVAFADVDADGDQDLAVGGHPNRVVAETRLYLNDGNGNFLQSYKSTFQGFNQGQLQFADVDGDSDPDLLLCGNTASDPITKLYLNDGKGVFTEKPNTAFAQVEKSAFALADVEADGDLDILLTGRNNSNQKLSRLYLNDGSGNFTQDFTNTFPGVDLGDLSFADVDLDNDPDLLIVGDSSFYAPMASFYRNDGQGNFSLDTSVHISAVAQAAIAFADVNADNYPDLMLTGEPQFAQRVSQLYLGDAMGGFYADTNNTFIDVAEGDVSFADIDNDNDQDVLISGYAGNSSKYTALYQNNGGGIFTELQTSDLKRVDESASAFADVDADGDQDLVIAGSYSTGTGNASHTRLYLNNGSGAFNEATNNHFSGLMFGEVEFADFDNDGDPDVIITGETGPYSGGTQPSTCAVYRNNGSGGYTKIQGNPFPDIYESSVAVADIDGDNDLDVAIMGKIRFTQYVAELYLNNGNGNFSLKAAITPRGVHEGSLDFADIDGDSDMDLLVTGQERQVSGYQDISKLFINDGSGNFTLKSNTSLTPVREGFSLFADVDGDNDQDLLISGRGPVANSFVTELYTNDGSGNYSLSTGNSFQGLHRGAGKFVDADMDGDLDLFLAGAIAGNSPPTSLTELYKNDGSGNFSVASNNTLPQVYGGSVDFADVDSDGDPDLLLSGGVGHSAVCSIYANDSTGNFTPMETTSLPAVEVSAVAFADIDLDNDPDVLVTGSSESGRVPFSRLYRNISCPGTITEVYDTACNSPEYYWPLTNTVYTQMGTYIYKVPSLNSCDTTVKLNLSFMSLDTAVVKTGSSLTAVLGNASYQWLDCDNNFAAVPGETNRKFTPSGKGNYAVAITSYSCTDTSACYNIGGVGINEQPELLHKIYPNPSSGSVRIELAETAPEGSLLMLYDLRGRLLQSLNLSGLRSSLLQIDSPEGVYILEIRSPGRHAARQKLLLQK